MNYFDYFFEACDPNLLSVLEAAKEGVFKDNYIYQDELQYPHVRDVLAIQVNREKIVEFTGKFMDDHVDQLSTVGPVKTFTFADKETSFFYDMFNTSPEELMNLFNKVVEETYFGKIGKFQRGWIEHAPYKILLVAILIDALQNNYDDVIECCKYLWAFATYPIVYREFWKVGVREDLMTYSMEHLGAKYKFIQRKMKTIKDLLKYHADISVASWKDRLLTGADNTYLDFMNRIYNQIKNSFKNISREYYYNHDHNKTFHQKDSTFDDGKMAEQEGITTTMSQVIDNTMNKLLLDWSNNALLGAAAEASQVDKSTLTGYVNQIFTTKGNRVGDFVEGIITAYFEKNPSSGVGINKSEFMSFGLTLYRSLGSADYTTLKDIMGLWMNTIINISNAYSSQGTIANYSRAVYNYMILMIAHYN